MITKIEHLNCKILFAIYLILLFFYLINVIHIRFKNIFNILIMRFFIINLNNNKLNNRSRLSSIIKRNFFIFNKIRLFKSRLKQCEKIYKIYIYKRFVKRVSCI